MYAELCKCELQNFVVSLGFWVIVDSLHFSAFSECKVVHLLYLILLLEFKLTDIWQRETVFELTSILAFFIWNAIVCAVINHAIWLHLFLTNLSWMLHGQGFCVQSVFKPG